MPNTKQSQLSRPTYQMDQESSTQGLKRISGLVKSIVDGNTFIMSVQVKNSALDKAKYDQKIKIHGSDQPAISTLSGILAKLELEKQIVGRIVECEILGDDKTDLIVASLPKQFLVPTYPSDPSDNI